MPFHALFHALQKFRKKLSHAKSSPRSAAMIVAIAVSLRAVMIAHSAMIAVALPVVPHPSAASLLLSRK